MQYCAPRGPCKHLARATPDLSGHEERDQDVGHPGELAVPRHQVVLVAPVGVARAVGVVLEQVDVARDALLVQAELGGGEEVLQDPLPRLVVRDDLADQVALGRRVLGVRADVEVQAGAVLQEDVRGAPPVHDPPEQVAGHLVGREPALPAERAGHAVLVLDPEDPPFHRVQAYGPPAGTPGAGGRAAISRGTRSARRSGAGGTSAVACSSGPAPLPRAVRRGRHESRARSRATAQRSARRSRGPSPTGNGP